MKLLYAFFPWINHHVALLPARWFLKFFLHLRVQGLDKVLALKHRRVIFASNHTSELDPIVFTAVLPFFSRFIPMFYVSRARKHYKLSGIKRFIYGGLFFKLWGAFPTFSGKNDYVFSLTHHIRILTMNMPVLIFPEGGIRKKDQDKKPPHGGVAFLADHMDAVIVPVRISGIEDMTASEFYARKRKCTVSFGDPIWLEEHASEHEAEAYKQKAQHVVDQIYSL